MYKKREKNRPVCKCLNCYHLVQYKDENGGEGGNMSDLLPQILLINEMKNYQNISLPSCFPLY